jgi:hypothetical protein
MEDGVMYVFWLMLVVNPLLAIWLSMNSFLKWQGFLRVIALIPLALLVYLGVAIISDISRDPTSHNLWPFEVIIWSFCGWSSLLAVRLVRAMFVCERKDEEKTDE